jgi:uncharacterized membrane protein YdbT with pleckstrin-like domain
MSYIDRNLLPDERILFRTRKHLIIFFFPSIWILFSIYATAYMRANIILNQLQWAPFLLGFIFLAYTWLEYTFSEFVVTSKRVMMREGFFYRHTNELRLTTISQVNVDQSLVGQLLNYGIVSINAFGAYDSYAMLDKPFLFQKYVNEQLDKLAR